ncbi:hypothetical protein HBZS_100630 [Helicobacter bizzozeronii CCUG 35545]|nr:hypothetical protein HBZS_100630 [Helicobacter bizzozeronii CCUG 35545]
MFKKRRVSQKTLAPVRTHKDSVFKTIFVIGFPFDFVLELVEMVLIHT